MENANWIAVQIYSFFAALTAGLLAGFFYARYKHWLSRSPRRLYRRHCWKTDALFGLMLALFFCAWWFLLTEGSVRVSVFAWIACGWLIAHLLAGHSHK